MGLSRAAGLVAGLLLLSGAAPPDARAQGREAPTKGRVLSARLTAEVPEVAPGAAGEDHGAAPGADGAVPAAPPAGGARTSRVELRYRVAATAEVRRVPVRGIAFLGVEPAAVRAAVGGAPAPVRLEPARGPLLSGAVELERPLAAGDTAELVLLYRVRSVVRASEPTFDVVLPLLFVDWQPAGAPEDMLRATVSIPGGYAADEVFPTVPREMTERDDVRRYDFRLQAIPSVVRLRGHAGEPPFLTFSRLVDLAVLALLLVAGGLGWRALRAGGSREGRRAAPGGDG